jgi:hypothetical protein
MKEEQIFLFNTSNNFFQINLEKITKKTSKLYIEICSIIFIQNFIKSDIINYQLYYNIKSYIELDIRNINLIKNVLDMNLKKL